MFDGSELARAIVANPGDIEAALSRYEAELFPRAEGSAAATLESQEILFAPRAPQSLIDMFAAMGETPAPISNES